VAVPHPRTAAAVRPLRSEAMTPRPTVTYDGNTYCLRSSRTEIPDLDSMERMAALIWLNRNTVARGYSRPRPNLRGYADAGRVVKR
jgi:hypothetical protein